MLRIIKERFHQGYRTLEYPRVQPHMPQRFCGRPHIAHGTCPKNCTLCRDICPTHAIYPHGRDGFTDLILNMGRCLFCAACQRVCPQQRIAFSAEHRLATLRPQDLLVGVHNTATLPARPQSAKGIFRKSFKLRQVSAGGCNACEADCNVLTTLVFDLGRFGIDFVASPRHADALVITGPVSENMRLALWDTYHATPTPRRVIAVGVCALSGGIFANSPECHSGVPRDMPVDVYIPGCPPHPWSILDGLLLAASLV